MKKRNFFINVIALCLAFVIAFATAAIATEEQDLRGDMNGDGRVNSDDAIYLLRHTLDPDKYPLDGVSCSLARRDSLNEIAALRAQFQKDSSKYSTADYNAIMLALDAAELGVNASETTQQIEVFMEMLKSQLSKYTTPEASECKHTRTREVPYSRVEPTCYIDGKYTVICRSCNLTWDEVVPAAHIYHNLKSTDGKYIKHFCSVCSHVYVEDLNGEKINDFSQIEFPFFYASFEEIEDIKNIADPFDGISFADSFAAQVITFEDGMEINSYVNVPTGTSAQNANGYFALKDDQNAFAKDVFAIEFMARFDEYPLTGELCILTWSIGGFEIELLTVDGIGDIKVIGNDEVIGSFSDKGWDQITVEVDPTTGKVEACIVKAYGNTEFGEGKIEQSVINKTWSYIKFFERQGQFEAYIDEIYISAKAYEPIINDPEDNPEQGGTVLPELGNRNGVKDSVPKNLNFNGDDVVFFVRGDNNFNNEMDVERTTNDVVSNAVIYRNATVEDRLGVEIKQVAQTWDSRSWNATLRNSVLTKSGDYDAAAIYASQSSALSVEGMYYNVLDIPYLDFSKPWWNRSIIDGTKVFNTAYFLVGDIVPSQTDWGVTLFFNKDLFSEFYSTQNINLYDEVRNGTWTVDKMYELTSGVWVDTNSDGMLNVGDTYGFQYANTAGDGAADAWVTAMGIDITTMVEGYPELTFYSEHTVEAFEKLRRLNLENPGTLVCNLNTPTADFIAGNQLFIRQWLNSGKEFRNMSDDYGVIPLPKFDEAQKGYRTNAANIASFVVVLSTVQEVETVGATLELMAAESYKQVTPNHYNILFKDSYSEASDDAEMFDYILGSYTYNFGYCYSTAKLGGIGGLFRVLSEDLSQKYESNKIMYQTSLVDLVDKLDEVSFMQ